MLTDPLSRASQRRQYILAAFLKAGDETALKALLKQLRALYRQLSASANRRILRAAIDRLEAAGSMAEARAAIQDLPLAELALEGAPREAIDNIQRLAYEAGAVAVAPAFSLTLKDRRALDLIGKQQLFWIGQHYEETLNARLNDLLRQAFDEGWSRKVTSQKLQEEFASFREPDETYFDALADHTVRKIREMGRVAGYEEAGIEYVKVRAILDERTSTICRQMNGRIISVRRLRNQVEDILRAESKDDLKLAQAWLPSFTGRTAELPEGLAAPPYHFRCRTITVAYFESVSQAGRKLQFYDGDLVHQDTVLDSYVDPLIGRELVIPKSAAQRTGLSEDRLKAAIRSVQNFGWTDEGDMVIQAGTLRFEFRGNVLWRRA